MKILVCLLMQLLFLAGSLILKLTFIKDQFKSHSSRASYTFHW